MERNLVMARSHRRGGYILILMLLVVVVLGVVFYYKSLSSSGINLENGQEFKNPPWQQWKKIEKRLAEGGLGAPDSQQPKITDAVAIKTSLFEIQGEKRSDRGTIILKFNPDYAINGTWSDKFFIDQNRDREFELSQCVIKGHFVPDETFAEIEKRNEPNEIYFLAKGTFVLVDYNYKNKTTSALKGDIYLSGWLLPDYTVRDGQAFMTSKKESVRVFTFAGKAGKMGVILGLP
jgi:hypothetical protein